jgi:ABC-2 type transport system permease protein
MKGTFLYLLLPSWRSFRVGDRDRAQKGSGTIKDAVIFILGAVFWVGIFYLFYRVLSYFQGVGAIGTLLAEKLLAMITVVFFSLLVFSNIVTAVSSFYLSEELNLLHAMPLSLDRIYHAKFVETLVSSSWMIVLFGTPVFGAYGVVYEASWAYYGAVLAGFVPLLVIAAALGILCTMGLVRLFPARRTKEVLALLAILVLVSLYLLFRFLQPERLFEEAELERFIDFLAVVRTPSSACLPSQWLTEFLVPLLFERPGAPLFHFLLLASTAMALVTIGAWVGGLIYLEGWMKSQEGAGTRIAASSWIHRSFAFLTRPFGLQARSVVRKDIKLFLRDTTQWTQLLLLGALVVVYLYNFRVLDLNKIPLATVYLQNLLSFLNMGLAGFVVSAVAIRFVFPAVSIEGKSFWLIRSAPISTRKLLRAKFWMYLVPLLVLSETLILLSNWFLNVSGFMMGLSAVTMVFLTAGVVGLGIGLGAAYPRFSVENAAKIATGYGAILYMILAMAFIALAVFLEAWPVNVIFLSLLGGVRVDAHRLVLVAVRLGLVVILSLAVCLLPMRWGARRLEAREW